MTNTRLLPVSANHKWASGDDRVLNASDLIREASRMYDAYDLDALPRALQRNSLDYYYLSIYPSLGEMRPLAPEDRPPHPETIHNAYIHIPFCSGVCEFCSYYLVPLSPKKRERIARYMDLVLRELVYHAEHATLDITYLYFGGGTPSLIPTPALAEFLSALDRRGWLNPKVLGTLELHPEFFGDPDRAKRFLDVLCQHGLTRVSVGYQVSDEQILSATKRRHQTTYIEQAMGLLRDNGFLVNLDLMYGLADQSLASWEATLRDAAELEPDSLSTYFLFVDRGTVTYDKVRQGRIALPSHRHAQTQHLMAQLFLEASGYHELPNDFYARATADPATFRQERLPSAIVTLPVGPGAYGHYSNTQLANVFDLTAYEQRIMSGETPLWRGYQLSPVEAFHRDVMFSLKNDPFLDCSLFMSHYNRQPLEVFRDTFDRLAGMGLVVVEGERIRLTSKGRLCVEEISSLFRHPDIRPSTDEPATDRRVLEKHNYAPTYPAVQW